MVFRKFLITKLYGQTCPLFSCLFSCDIDDDKCDPNYSEAAFWGSITTGLSNGVGFLFDAFIGRISDSYGCRRFFMLNTFLIGMLYFLLAWTDNLWYYYGFRILGGLAGMDLEQSICYGNATKNNPE